MSNTRQCRKLNRGSGQLQRPRGSWGMRRQMFAGSGATAAQQMSFLETMRAANRKVAESVRHVQERVAGTITLGRHQVGDR